MEKTKVDFIADLLESKKLDATLKERFLGLAAKEIKKIGEVDSMVNERLSELERKINSHFETQSTKDKKNIIPPQILKTNFNKPVEESSLPRHTDPKNIANFLKEYNGNLFLKSTTHLLDKDDLDRILIKLKISEFDYRLFIERIRVEFEDLKVKYPVNKGLVGKLNEFLFDITKKGWSSDKIKIGWSTPEIIKWCSDNKGMIPSPDQSLNEPGCSLTKSIDLKTGVQLNSFSEIVTHFKKEIEFRDDAYIENIIPKINKIIESENPDFKIHFNTDGIKENIRFYSDVEKVKQAYKAIIQMCIRYRYDNPHIEKTINFDISLKEEKIDGATIIKLSINDTLSVFNKTPFAIQDRYGTDISRLIEKLINGLCDWVLIAEFPNQECGSISLWPKLNKFNTIGFDNFKGVQFDLIFYRIS